MNPKISIIVPIYKVEAYLAHCVQSILNQTYQNFELILVDDGSPDTCPILCDEYAKKYEKIKAIHKTNGGLSDARNVGMKSAKGEYITFVDSDDYIHPLYLEMLLIALKKTKADFSVVNFKKVYNMTTEVQLSRTQIRIQSYPAIKALTKILYQSFHDVCAWGILLPKEIANEFPFPEGKLFEDLYTTYKYYFQVKEVAFVYAPLYYYLQRKNSIMAKRNSQFIFDLLDATNLLVEHCNSNEELQLAAKNKRFSNYCRIISLVSDLKQCYPKIYKNIEKTLKIDRWSILCDGHSRIKNKVAAFVLYAGIPMLRVLYKIKNSFLGG